VSLKVNHLLRHGRLLPLTLDESALEEGFFTLEDGGCLCLGAVSGQQLSLKFLEFLK
jgi:hypothetical protein